MMTYRETATDIGRRVNALEFGEVFRIYPLGTVSPLPYGELYAPTVYHDETADVVVDGAGWEPLTGMTGQHGYNGAVMHSSEFVGYGIASRLWDEAHDAGEAQTYVLVVVDCLEDDEPAGWAILRYVGA